MSKEEISMNYANYMIYQYNLHLHLCKIYAADLIIMRGAADE
jgi:hypothetical protein